MLGAAPGCLLAALSSVVIAGEGTGNRGTTAVLAQVGYRPLTILFCYEYEYRVTRWYLEYLSVAAGLHVYLTSRLPGMLCAQMYRQIPGVRSWDQSFAALVPRLLLLLLLLLLPPLVLRLSVSFWVKIYAHARFLGFPEL